MANVDASRRDAAPGDHAFVNSQMPSKCQGEPGFDTTTYKFQGVQGYIRAGLEHGIPLNRFGQPVGECRLCGASPFDASAQRLFERCPGRRNEVVVDGVMYRMDEIAQIVAAAKQSAKESGIRRERTSTENA